MTRPVTSSAQVPTAAGLPVEDVTRTLSDRKTYIEPGGRVGALSTTQTRSTSRSRRTGTDDSALACVAGGP